MSIDNNNQDHVRIAATSGSEVDKLLSASVLRLQQRAGREQARGILVTRWGIGHFTVELTGDVPYGLTQELVRDVAQN